MFLSCLDSSGLNVNLPSLWGPIIAAVIALMAVIIGTYFTYRFARRHSRAVHNTEIKVEQLRRHIDALENIWSLLAYVSLSASDRAIISWRKDKKGGGKKAYYLHFGRLKQFLLVEISQVFYQNHAGLYLSQDIRDHVFAFKRILMGLYIRLENDKSIDKQHPIKLESTETAKAVEKAYNTLNKALKEELEKLYQELLIKDKK